MRKTHGTYTVTMRCDNCLVVREIRFTQGEPVHGVTCPTCHAGTMRMIGGAKSPPMCMYTGARRARSGYQSNRVTNSAASWSS